MAELPEPLKNRVANQTRKDGWWALLSTEQCRNVWVTPLGATRIRIEKEQLPETLHVEGVSFRIWWYNPENGACLYVKEKKDA